MQKSRKSNSSGAKALFHAARGGTAEAVPFQTDLFFPQREKPCFRADL